MPVSVGHFIRYQTILNLSVHILEFILFAEIKQGRKPELIKYITLGVYSIISFQNLVLKSSQVNY